MAVSPPETIAVDVIATESGQYVNKSQYEADQQARARAIAEAEQIKYARTPEGDVVWQTQQAQDNARWQNLQAGHGNARVGQAWSGDFTGGSVSVGAGGSSAPNVKSETLLQPGGTYIPNPNFGGVAPSTNPVYDRAIAAKAEEASRYNPVTGTYKLVQTPPGLMTSPGVVPAIPGVAPPATANAAETEAYAKASLALQNKPSLELTQHEVVGSPSWYAKQISAREAAAKQNTLATPVNERMPEYFEFIAPPSSLITKSAAATSPVSPSSFLATVEEIRVKSGFSPELIEQYYPVKYGTNYNDWSAGIVGDWQFNKNAGVYLKPLNITLIPGLPDVNPNIPHGDIVGALSVPKDAPNPFLAGVVLGSFNIGLGMQNWLGETSTKAYEVTAKLPGITSFFGNEAVGFGVGVAGIVPFVLMEPVSAAVVGSAFASNPAGASTMVLTTAKEMGVGLWAREQTNPGSTIGTLAGMYAGGKLGNAIYERVPVGTINMKLSTGAGYQNVAENAWVSGKLAGSPVVQGFVDQLGVIKEFKDYTAVKGVWIGGSAKEPGFVTGIATGPLTSPEVFVGKTGSIFSERGLYNILSETFIESDAGFAVGRAPPKPIESALMNEFFLKTATDDFTRSLVGVQGILAKSEQLKLLPAELAGFPEMRGMSFETRLGVMAAFQKAGPNAIIGGSAGFPIWLSPEHARSSIWTSLKADVDSVVTLKEMNPLQKELRDVFAGTGINPARNTIADISLAIREPGVISGEVNWEVLAKYMTPEGIYRIPTGFSAHSLPGSKRLTPQEIAATELLVKRTGSPGLYELVDYENKLSRVSEKLDILPVQPLGTFQHAALTPEAQRAVFRTISGLGQDVQAIGSFQYPNMWGPDYFPSGIERSDIDLDIARKYMNVAAERMATGIRGNLQRPDLSLIPKGMAVNRDLLLGLSEQGKNIGFEGKVRGNIAPLAEPSSKGFHIAEVGIASETDRIIGAQAMEITFGVRTKMYPGIEGEIKAQTPESYILSQLSRSFGETKKGQEIGYWEYNPSTGKTRLVTVFPKAEKDITRIYATSKGIASSALDLGNIPIAARYARFADVMSDVGNQMGIDVYGSTKKDILAGKNVPTVTQDIEPELVLDQSLAAISNKPVGRAVEPLTRGFSFSPRGEEHVLGAQQLEGHPEVKYSMVPSIAGGSIALQTLRNAIEMKLSRMSGGAKYVYTPDVTIDIKTGKRVPAGTRVVSGLGGSKPSSDLIDIITGLGKIAKEAREQGYPELATEATVTQIAFTSKLKSEFGIDIKDVVQEPLMIRTAPEATGRNDISFNKKMADIMAPLLSNDEEVLVIFNERGDPFTTVGGEVGAISGDAFKKAILNYEKVNPESMGILIHTHPSGRNPFPSALDLNTATKGEMQRYRFGVVSDFGLRTFEFESDRSEPSKRRVVKNYENIRTGSFYEYNVDTMEQLHAKAWDYLKTRSDIISVNEFSWEKLNAPEATGRVLELGAYSRIQPNVTDVVDYLTKEQIFGNKEVPSGVNYNFNFDFIKEKLPYQENTFDKIVSSYALGSKGQDFSLISSEMSRVLIPGGEVEILGGYEPEKMVSSLKNEGFEVDLKLIPQTVGVREIIGSLQPMHTLKQALGLEPLFSPDVFITARKPNVSGYRIMGEHPLLNDIIPAGSRLRMEIIEPSEADITIAKIMGFPESHSIRAISPGTKPTQEQIDYYSSKYGITPLQTYTFAEPISIANKESETALARTSYAGSLESIGERSLVVIPPVIDYMSTSFFFPKGFPDYATFGSLSKIQDRSYSMFSEYQPLENLDTYLSVDSLILGGGYKTVRIPDKIRSDYGIYIERGNDEYIVYKPIILPDKIYNPYPSNPPQYKPITPYPPGYMPGYYPKYSPGYTPEYFLGRSPSTSHQNKSLVWPWESKPSEIYKKKRKPQSSYIFREILPVITPIEEVGGFRSGKPFFRTIGNQQILEVRPQTRDYLHYVDVDMDVRELQQKETANRVSDMAGVGFYRTATKQEKAKTGKPIVTYIPTQAELNVAKMVGFGSGAKSKGRRKPWF